MNKISYMLTMDLEKVDWRVNRPLNALQNKINAALADLFAKAGSQLEKGAALLDVPIDLGLVTRQAGARLTAPQTFADRINEFVAKNGRLPIWLPLDERALYQGFRRYFKTPEFKERLSPEAKSFVDHADDSWPEQFARRLNDFVATHGILPNHKIRQQITLVELVHKYRRDPEFLKNLSASSQILVQATTLPPVENIAGRLNVFLEQFDTVPSKDIPEQKSFAVALEKFASTRYREILALLTPRAAAIYREKCRSYAQRTAIAVNEFVARNHRLPVKSGNETGLCDKIRYCKKYKQWDELKAALSSEAGKLLEQKTQQ